jgi:5'-3' exoribonuclease 1
MERLNDHVRYYVHARINEDSRWQKLKVIVSGSDEPGEGEHKIAEYIRREKMQPNYDPNTRHCLYGMDFDLILLGLCFHEPYFSIIREKVVFKSRREETSSKEELSLQRTNDFQFVHLSLLRHYLDLELRINRQAQNLERVLDDFIFMTFFVGNDFLPTLPSLEIDDGGIATLFSIYRELAPGMQKMTGQVSS